MLGFRPLGSGPLGSGPIAAAGGFLACWAIPAMRSGLIGAKQMYPKNAVSPERIAVGQVILIADGTIQTSAVSIVVRGQGGAEGAGGGTTAYGADGTVYYTPTQAETNYTSFVVIAYKASCFSASQTIVPTASSTAGQVDVKSIAGTAQTANDNGADINTLISGGYPARFDTIETLIGDIGSGSAGISVIAGSSVEAVAGTPTNTYAVTDQLDAIYHIVPDLANNTDFYYEFDVGVNGVPIEVEWVGYAQANNATYKVYFYNWTTLAWNQVGFITGTTGATEQKHTYTATVDHVGTGGDDGAVRFRFLSTDGANLGTDFIVCDYAVVDSTSIAAILTDTGTTLPALIATAQADLDIITGASGVNLLTATQASIDAILVDTAEIGAAGAGLTDLGGMSTAMKAEVNAEADTALTDYGGPTNAQMEARTPTAAQLAYITRHAATAKPVTFTGGTTTTAILGNVDGVAASSVDDTYNSRLFVFDAGTLDEQVCQITDYVGATKTATISAVTTAVTSGHTAVLV